MSEMYRTTVVLFNGQTNKEIDEYSLVWNKPEGVKINNVYFSIKDHENLDIKVDTKPYTPVLEDGIPENPQFLKAHLSHAKRYIETYIRKYGDIEDPKDHHQTAWEFMYGE